MRGGAGGCVSTGEGVYQQTVVRIGRWLRRSLKVDTFSDLRDLLVDFFGRYAVVRKSLKRIQFLLSYFLGLESHM